MAHVAGQLMQVLHGRHGQFGGAAEPLPQAALHLDIGVHAGDLGLHLGDFLHDVGGGQCGLFRQGADFPRDHGEAATGVTGPRRLDGSVEGKQIGLTGDAADEIDDPVDLLRMGRKGIDLLRCLIKPALHVDCLAL